MASKFVRIITVVYEIDFVPPQPGVYYVHFRIPSLEVPYSQIFPLVLEAKRK